MKKRIKKYMIFCSSQQGAYLVAGRLMRGFFTYTKSNIQTNIGRMPEDWNVEFVCTLYVKFCDVKIENYQEFSSDSV